MTTVCAGSRRGSAVPQGGSADGGVAQGFVEEVAGLADVLGERAGDAGGFVCRVAEEDAGVAVECAAGGEGFLLGAGGAGVADGELGVEGVVVEVDAEAAFFNFGGADFVGDGAVVCAAVLEFELCLAAGSR